jgi:hypothetical protein
MSRVALLRCQRQDIHQAGRWPKLIGMAFAVEMEAPLVGPLPAFDDIPDGGVCQTS